MSSTAEGIEHLQRLRTQLDATLAAATQHAGGAIDAQAWAQACAALADAVSALRSGHAALTHDAVTATLLAEIGTRIQTLLELQTRLDAANRQALAQLLPQDALQAYAQLGRQARVRTAYR